MADKSLHQQWEEMANEYTRLKGVADGLWLKTVEYFRAQYDGKPTDLDDSVLEQREKATAALDAHWQKMDAFCKKNV